MNRDDPRPSPDLARLLIDQYMAVRMIPGEANRIAHDALRSELKAIGPVEHRGWVWQYSRGDDSIARASTGRHRHARSDAAVGPDKRRLMNERVDRVPCSTRRLTYGEEACSEDKRYASYIAMRGIAL